MKAKDVHDLTRDILSLPPDKSIGAVLTWMPDDFANSGRAFDKVEESKKAGEDNYSVLCHDLSSFCPMSLSPEDLRALLDELQHPSGLGLVNPWKGPLDGRQWRKPYLFHDNSTSA